ncbi:ATP-binding protein [Tepidibacillus sp. LV47]|uniref:ATP-binding protein n=1 Tax=Tepidibacillus sp. LV47 TaxID=3398228 RepID=UPI003AACE970
MAKTLYSRLLLFALFISMVPMIFVGYISYQAHKESLTKEMDQNLFLLSNNLAVEIENFISERLMDVNLLQENELLNKNNASIEDIKRELKKFVQVHTIYEGAILTDDQGIVIYDTNEGVIGKDLSKRSWFQPAIHGNIYISDIYLSPALNKPLLTLAGPITNQKGEIIGVVSPAINLNELYKTMDQFANESKNVNLSAYAFLINRNGDYIAHPNRAKILKENFFKKNHLDLNQLEELSKNKQIFYSTTENTVNAFTRIKPTKGFQHDWYIGVSVTKDEFYTPLKQLLIKYLILFGVMLTLIILAVIPLARSIVLPINQLVAATSDFAKGKKVKPLNIDTYQELNQLNHTFNLMTEQLKEREKQLIRSEKLKAAGELAAGFVHEIRNPITTIRGFLQIMNEEKIMQDKPYFPIIFQEIDRVNRIITDFLTFAKPNTSFHNVPTDLNQVIDEVLLLFESQMPMKNILIDKDLMPVPKTVLDPTFIKQVFINLIQNAIDAMPQGGSLTISTRYEMADQQIMIFFQDTGIGMDQKTIEKLGTPFFTTKEKGTGLGLMISYQIIQELNGKITVDSQSGLGTTFTIHLPVTNSK